MRYLISLLLLPLISLPLHAASGVSVETIMRAAQLGTPQLALQQVQAEQSESIDRASWFTWEVARWDLLHQLKRWSELQQSTETPPFDAPAAMKDHARWRNAQATVALRQNREARERLAQLLWKDQLEQTQLREARRLVIETLLSERRGEQAYLAILRFQQDFNPIESRESELFARGLASRGRPEEALALLPQNEGGALEMLLKLRTGRIATDQAIVLARAALERGGVQEYWEVVVEAATRQQDLALQVEGLEMLLTKRNDNDGATKLKQAYSAYALALGNQHHLLQGDDAAWLSLSEQMEQTNSLGSRALLAHQMQQAVGSVEQRRSARSRLLGSLLRAGHVRTAFALFHGRQDLLAMLLQNPRWLENAATLRGVLEELAVTARESGECEQALDYLLPASDDLP